MRLFTELNRRNVLRMAVLYIVAAWAVMQAAEVVIGLANLPDWIGPTILAVLAIGFPIALIFSWFFEITSEGLSLEKDTPEGQSITHATGRRMDFVIIAILSAGLILFAYDKWWPREPLELSIAVLPFENMSADPEQEYFSDGISEEILNLLAQIESLKVIARHSSFSFKGKDIDIATMAEQMGVRHILEGSVRRSGDRMRVTAQLIDAKDSSHLWSETYDHDYSAENLFEIQSEIARAITGRLRVTLTGADEQRLVKVPTQNTEAYAAYLLGRQRLTDRKVAELVDAVEQFARAIELDPRFAGAYSGLADACRLYALYSGGHSNESCPASPAEREQLARKALELDPESGEAWISLGFVLAGQWNQLREGMPTQREAIAAYERGLELNPTLTQGYLWYGNALQAYFLYPDLPSGWIDAWQSGVWKTVFDKGLDVDPLSIPLHVVKADFPQVAHSKEEAIRHGHRIVEIAPDSPRGYSILGQQHWNLYGQIDEFVRWTSKALKLDPQRPFYYESIGLAYSALGDPDMALAYFDLVKAVTAPDNTVRQNQLLVYQAIIRLVSGKAGAHEVAEFDALLKQARSETRQKLLEKTALLDFEVFVALSMGRPADALALIGTATPKCLEVNDIPDDYYCPIELIRVFQELDNQTSAQVLIDEYLRISRLWVDGVPWNGIEGQHARVLAVAGRKNEALDVFEKVVSSGWRGEAGDLFRFRMYFDVTFEPIRDDPRFQAALAVIEADMAQQLESVREMERNGEIPALEELKAMIASKSESDGY